MVAAAESEGVVRSEDPCGERDHQTIVTILHMCRGYLDKITNVKKYVWPIDRVKGRTAYDDDSGWLVEALVGTPVTTIAARWPSCHRVIFIWIPPIYHSTKPIYKRTTMLYTAWTGQRMNDKSTFQQLSSTTEDRTHLRLATPSPSCTSNHTPPSLVSSMKTHHTMAVIGVVGHLFELLKFLEITTKKDVILGPAPRQHVLHLTWDDNMDLFQSTTCSLETGMVSREDAPKRSKPLSRLLPHRQHDISPIPPPQILPRFPHPFALTSSSSQRVCRHLPRDYHTSLNLGFNCAERVNFAPDSWIDLEMRTAFSGGLIEAKGREKNAEVEAKSSGPSPSRAKAKAKAPAEDVVVVLAFPCCLYASTAVDGLFRVIPETWMDEMSVDSVTGKEKLVRDDGVVKDWILKCSASRPRFKVHGAHIEYTKTFHVTCAAGGAARGVAYRVLEVEKVALVDEVQAFACTCVSAAAHDEHDGIVHTPADVPPPATAPPTSLRLGVIKTIEKHHFMVLCSHHSPVWSPNAVVFIEQLGTEYTSLYDSISLDWRRLAGLRAKVLKISGLDTHAVDRIAQIQAEVIWVMGSKLTMSSPAAGLTTQMLGDSADPVSRKVVPSLPSP
ncbi:hypothetical protein K439DRAFT_1616139 [Ramaria rubella]|nr:hypothetical protein K439DRAFT_1616139 [Ramaria rubella]